MSKQLITSVEERVHNLMSASKAEITEQVQQIIKECFDGCAQIAEETSAKLEEDMKGVESPMQAAELGGGKGLADGLAMTFRALGGDLSGLGPSAPAEPESED